MRETGRDVWVQRATSLKKPVQAGWLYLEKTLDLIRPVSLLLRERPNHR